jgi:hypothetical protein
VRTLRRVAAALTIVAISAVVAGAQEPLQQSPITSGFWTWPRQKPASAQAVSDECRKKIAVQFADGHYFALRFPDADKKALSAPVVDEVGFCQFDRAKQTERCELRVNKDDGTADTGEIESTFVIAADHSITMTVTPKSANGAQSTAASFIIYPVRCPDGLLWDILNGSSAQK